MTPKDKADELVSKFWKKPQENNEIISSTTAKLLALMAVDEILNSRKEHLVQSLKFYEYWTEVKKAVEIL